MKLRNFVFSLPISIIPHRSVVAHQVAHFYPWIVSFAHFHSQELIVVWSCTKSTSCLSVLKPEELFCTVTLNKAVNRTSNRSCFQWNLQWVLYEWTWRWQHLLSIQIWTLCSIVLGVGAQVRCQLTKWGHVLPSEKSWIRSCKNYKKIPSGCGKSSKSWT